MNAPSPRRTAEGNNGSLLVHEAEDAELEIPVHANPQFVIRDSRHKMRPIQRVEHGQVRIRVGEKCVDEGVNLIEREYGPLVLVPLSMESFSFSLHCLFPHGPTMRARLPAGVLRRRPRCATPRRERLANLPGHSRTRPRLRPALITRRGQPVPHRTLRHTQHRNRRPHMGCAQRGTWCNAERPGDWTLVERHFLDGHTESGWAADARPGGYGPHSRRSVVATTGPAASPEGATWYLITNLPHPDAARTATSTNRPADPWPYASSAPGSPPPSPQPVVAGLDGQGPALRAASTDRRRRRRP